MPLMWVLSMALVLPESKNTALKLSITTITGTQMLNKQFLKKL